jgi:hypothetical protein
MQCCLPSPSPSSYTMIHQQHQYSGPESSVIVLQVPIPPNPKSSGTSNALDKMRTNVQLPPSHTFKKAVFTHSASTNIQSRKRSRQVRFSEARVVATVVNRLDLSQEQADQIWYPPSELEQFKTEARILCRRLREQQQLQRKENNPQEHVHIPRGLEQRVCGQRQRRRYLAVCCVLKAQQKCRCSDFIGRVAHKCTQWATDIAHLEGQHDFCDVYHPEMKTLLPKVTDVPMYKLPIQTKRKVECNNNNISDDSDNDSIQAAQRNVRARTV